MTWSLSNSSAYSVPCTLGLVNTKLPRFPWTHDVFQFSNRCDCSPSPFLCQLVHLTHCSHCHSDHCLRNTSSLLPAGLPLPFLFSFPKVITSSPMLESYKAIVSSLVSEFKSIWVSLLSPPPGNSVISDDLFNLKSVSFLICKRGQ